MYTTPTTRIRKIVGLTVALFCLTVMFQLVAQADTLNIVGSSNSQTPIAGSSGSINFVGQGFSQSFNVTGIGQTFNFVFGRYSIPSSAAGGDSGCTDGPCSPLTLTGSLTTPSGSLSFNGMYEEAIGPGHFLTVDWMTNSGPFNYITPEGGVVIFTVELLDFNGNNPGATTLLFDQVARITITGFQAGQTPVPEPATMVLLGTGLAGLYAAKRQRKQA